MLHVPFDPVPTAPDPLPAVLGLFQALVTVLARPESVESMLQEALQTTVTHLGGTGGALTVWRAGSPEPAISACCGALASEACMERPDVDLYLARLPLTPGLLQALAFEWGEVVAIRCGLSLLGATSWLTHRGEYAAACIVGPREPQMAPWRQDALAAAGGLVGHALERMRLSAETEARLAERDKRWSSLYEIGLALTRELDGERLIDVIVRQSISLLHARGGVLSLVEEATGDSVVKVAYVDGQPAPYMLGYRSSRGEGLVGRVIESGEPAVVPDHQFGAGPDSASIRTSVIAVPLFVQGACAGVLAVGDKAPARQFANDEVQTLVLLAHQAGALLERARSRAHDEMLSIHRERSRLARELHDGLAQNLASLLLKAELCHDLARSGAPELVPELDLLAGGLQQAVRETRAAIFSLHESPSEGAHLLDGLRLLTARFAEQTGRTVSLTWEGDANRALTSAQHMALLNVTQEALNNVRKHARATRISVHLNASCHNFIKLSVQDDGCGFALEHLTETANSGHYGILGMRTRIEELGGSLLVDSGARRGTTVTAVLPMVRSGGL